MNIAIINNDNAATKVLMLNAVITLVSPLKSKWLLCKTTQALLKIPS
jgi:hypothetical protein